jgi:hypothetical protein
MGKNLIAPNGKPIWGTKETVPGVAVIEEGTATQNADGTFSFQHSGETDMDWDNQRTVERNGQRVFVDEDGGEWLESELKLAD